MANELVDLVTAVARAGFEWRDKQITMLYKVGDFKTYQINRTHSSVGDFGLLHLPR